MEAEKGPSTVGFEPGTSSIRNQHPTGWPKSRFFQRTLRLPKCCPVLFSTLASVGMALVVIFVVAFVAVAASAAVVTISLFAAAAAAVAALDSIRPCAASDAAIARRSHNA